MFVLGLLTGILISVLLLLGQVYLAKQGYSLVRLEKRVFKEKAEIIDVSDREIERKNIIAHANENDLDLNLEDII
tara:strand:- start:1422 stop:1646 length:225 start_codon:yes stop_codon:yes gene_type:complete